MKLGRNDDVPELDSEPLSQRWKEFQKQDYEGQIALFFKTLEQPELMDDEMAFAMLNTLYPKICDHNERDRYEALVDELRECLPEIYFQSAHFYLFNRIINALVAGRFELISPFMNELAQRAGKDIDIFDNAVNLLAYHGQLSCLVEAMRIAWPKIDDSGELVPWAIDESTDQVVMFLVFDHIEQHGWDTARHPELFERIKVYSEFEQEQIIKHVALLTGQSDRQWTKKDFTFKPRRQASRERNDDENTGIQIPKPVRQNLYDMSLEFQGHLRRKEDIPLTKGELGRVEIVRYLFKRLAGELEPRLSMIEAVFNAPKPKGRPPESYLAGDADSVNWLCPDRDTLDRFLVDLLHFVNPQHHSAVATLELIPAWLRFLESRELITASRREQSLHDLRKLSTDLAENVRLASKDTALLRAMERWWETAQAHRGQ